MISQKVEINGKMFEIEAESMQLQNGRIPVTVNQKKLEIDISDDLASMIINKKSYFLEQYRSVDGIPCRLTIDGMDYHIDFPCTPEEKKQRTRKKVASGRITAPIAGTIHAIHVKPGDTVNEGQPLIVLEAMKMQNSVDSPVSGEVISINVEEGQSVAGGSLMLEISVEA